MIEPILKTFQVEHVFSDKTGTLTENKMIFRACSIGEMLFKVPFKPGEEQGENIATNMVSGVNPPSQIFCYLA